MNVADFKAQWRSTTLNERQSAVPHFESLCRLLDHQTPTELDPEGRFFVYVKGLGKTGGGGGFSDVWYRRHFGWDDPDLGRVDEDLILGRLLALNQERATAHQSP